MSEDRTKTVEATRTKAAKPGASLLSRITAGQGSWNMLLMALIIIELVVLAPPTPSS